MEQLVALWAHSTRCFRWPMFSWRNTLVSPSLITWNGVSMSQKSLPKQLSHLVSFAGTWLLHLGVLRKLHTKLWFERHKLEYAALIWSPHSKLQINQIEKLQRTAARWTCRRWRNTSSVGEMLDKLEWPSLEARRNQSSLLLFHKIHCGAVSIEKYKYMTPAHSLKISGHHIVLNTADTRHTVMP